MLVITTLLIYYLCILESIDNRGVVMSARIGYARTSTESQLYGLEDQIAKLKAAGCDVIYSEQVSSVKMEERKEWAKLLSNLTPNSTVVITSVSRLARSMKDMADIVAALKVKNVSLAILDMNISTDTVQGSLMFNIFTALATWERDLLLERQAVGIKAAKEADKHLPLSQRTYKGRTPTARAKLETVKTLLAAGKSKEAIAKDLNIGIASVYRMLKSDS